MAASTISKGLPEGVYQVKVSQIIDPASFYVTDPPGPSPGRSRVQAMEKTLSRLYQGAKRSVLSTDVCDLVAVKNPNTNSWHRGYIESIIHTTQSYIYEVFLIDHGLILRTDNSALRELPRKMQSFPCQVFEVVLDKIVPISLPEQNIEDQRSISQSWMPDAYEFVTNLLNESEHTYVLPYQITVDRKIYGDIYVQTNGMHNSVASLLCEAGHAQSSHEDFQEYMAHRSGGVGYANEVSSVSSSSLAGNHQNSSSSGSLSPFVNGPNDTFLSGFVQNCKTNIFGKDLSSKEKIEEWRKRNSDVESLSVDQNVSRSRIKLAEVASSLQAEETCSFQPSLSFAYASPKPDLNINQHMNLLDILKSKDNSSLGKTSHDSVPGSQSLLILENLLSNLPRGRSSSRNSNASSGGGTVHSRSKITDFQENNIVQTSKTDDEALSYVAVEKSTDDKTLGSETSSKQSMVDSAFHSRLDTFKFVERHTLNRVLAHGQFMAKPLQGLEHANFPSQIHKALQKVGFQSLMSIQSYTFVSILRGQNVFIVGPPRSGKTLSYLLPLLSNCVTGETFQNLKPGCGPFILILCPGHKSAQFIYNASCKLLRLAGVSNVDVMITYGGGDELEKMITLMNGCHILISTPRRFLKLAKTSSHIVSLNRVCHLVLEEADTLTTKCAVEVKGIVESCKQISKKRDIPTQMVFVSEMWTPTIEFLADRVAENSSVCIGSCLEAAVYAKLKPNLHFVEPLIKDNKLIEVLGSNSDIIKTVIVCQTAKEVIHVVTLLESFNFKTLGVHEKKFHFVTTELITEWKHSKSGCYSVLVCSDDVLLELKIMDAMKLIHYDLPTNSKTQFGYRFSCLMDNYRNIFQQLDEDRLECSVHIFVDINDVHQFPSVISFMKRLGAVMPREVDEKVEIVEREMEHLKISQPLCFNVKAFGDCWKGSNCLNRHFISLDLDHGDLPDHGEVKVKILHVHSAQCFSVRLLEHKGKNGVMTPIPNSYWNIAVDLNKLFRDPETRYPASNLTVGDICAVKVGTNLFQRVRVDKIISSGYKSKPSTVRVTFMDEGSVKEYKDYALMALPKELQVLPPQAVEVYLCNVLPCDEDTVWNWSANEAMYNWVQENVAEEREGVYMVGKIVLTLGNTLWLDPFMARQHLEDLGNDVFIMSLRKELLKHGYAVDNPQHLEKLYSLCHDADIPVPCMSQKAETDQLNDQRYVVNEQQEDSVSPKEQQEDSVSPKEQYLHTDMIKDEVITQNSPFKENEVIKREKTLLNRSDKKRQALKPQWAFIPKDEWCPILLRSAINPNEVFVQVEKFSESLERLSKDLQAHVQKQHVPVTPEIGLFCLGLFPEDNLWYRAQIVQITNDKKVELFFVDHGDFQFVDVDSLADITDTLINKLPFQAIECRLVGVKPKRDNIWSEAATDSLYHWSEIIGNLSVKVCTTGPATWTGTLKYGVVMVSGTGEAMSIVNQELVIDNNLGCEFLNEEIDYLDNLANPRQNLKVDENEEHDTDFLDEEEFDINFDDQESMAFMAKALGLPETLLITPEQQAPSTMKAIEMAPCLEKCSSQLVDESMESKPDGTCTPRDSVPTLSNCVRTPSVTWHQDTACVNVRIAVTDLRSYYVKCEPTRLQFRANVNEGTFTYFLDMFLYGVINIEEVACYKTNCEIHVKLRKITPGVKWAHLLQSSQKTVCAKWNTDHIEDGDDYSYSWDSTENFKCTQNLPAGFIDIDEESESEDEGSDTMEQRNEVYDPMDPLN